jgi:hypothetical protein
LKKPFGVALLAVAVGCALPRVTHQQMEPGLFHLEVEGDGYTRAEQVKAGFRDEAFKICSAGGYDTFVITDYEAHLKERVHDGVDPVRGLGLSTRLGADGMVRCLNW